MQESTPSAAGCRSVFREGEAGLTSEIYTRMWIRLINQIEQSKAAVRARING